MPWTMPEMNKLCTRVPACMNRMARSTNHALAMRMGGPMQGIPNTYRLGEVKLKREKIGLELDQAEPSHAFTRTQPVKKFQAFGWA